MSAQPPESDAGHIPTFEASDAETGASARERLAQSRQRMSYWLLDEEHAASEPGSDPGSTNDSHRPHDSVGNPVAAIAIDVMTEWWNQHPLHASASLAGAAARGAIVPLVRRHPAVVLGVAAIAGAVLVRSRAWRWLLRPALVAGIASQIASRFLSRAATVQIVNSR